MAKTEPSTSKTAAKRSLRPAQTVREQANKAQAKSQQPTKARRVRAAAATTRKPFTKLGRVLNRVFNRQPFRFIGKIILPPFIRSSFRELRLVTWPGRRETTRLTFAVLMFAIIFGAIVTVVDYGLDKLFKALIIK